MHLPTCLSTLIVLGLPVSVSGAVTVTFDESAETVTFSWTYDNTMNIIPATSFNVTITPVNGGTPITRTVDINDLSLTLSFSDLMSETGYTVSVVAVNQLGGSVAIGNTFESPGNLAYMSGMSYVHICSCSTKSYL